MELSKIHRETRVCAARELSQQLKELPALRDEFIKDVELEASTWSMEGGSCHFPLGLLLRFT
jgi:hypothetical protein